MQTIPSLSDPAILASRFINQTNKHIFLTGKAGTGKTTFLRHIIQNTHKKAVIAAPTGIAAINAGGVTLHSLFQLPFGAFIPRHQSETNHLQEGLFNTITSIASNNKMHASKRQLLREIELLIIDEVSMLRADILDAIDTVLRVVRKKNNVPFGGVQCLFIGDLLQLPPVIKDQEWHVLKNYYKSIFFFDSVVLSNNRPLYIELDKVYRQSDDEFIGLLNNLRNNTITENDISILNKHYKPEYLTASNDNVITLTTHNYKADNINKDFLNKLTAPVFSYDAEVEDDFSEYSYPVEYTLQLKAGAQVMFIKNDYSGSQRYFNGKIGKVKELSKTTIEVEFEDKSTIKVDKYEWENKKYQLNPLTNEIEEKVIGKFKHYPIKLAWAITVHKSQGLTFEKAIIDVERAFAPGQVYVALSRLKSLDGLILTSKINYDNITTDSSVAGFAHEVQMQPEPQAQLENETIAFLRTYLLVSFDFSGLLNSCNDYVSELKETSAKTKKGTKAKYYEWALQLQQTTSEAKNHADKFAHQIERILHEKSGNFLEHLRNRVGDAKNYFEPILKKSSSSIFYQIEKLSSEKKTKQHAKDLTLLEIHYFEQMKKLNKALGLCNAVLIGKEFSKQQSDTLVHSIERKEELAVTINSKEKTQTNEKPKKEKKQLGKELSFQLFNEGKSIEEIAKQREMAVSTIEKHLTHYVETGELPLIKIMSEERMAIILSAQKELDTHLLNPIKSLLGDEYSYAEIRFALASMGK